MAPEVRFQLGMLPEGEWQAFIDRSTSVTPRPQSGCHERPGIASLWTGTRCRRRRRPRDSVAVVRVSRVDPSGDRPLDAPIGWYLDG